MFPNSKSLRHLAISCGATAVLASALCGCNPYERRAGEYSAGAVDPVKFPKVYLGGGTGNRPGSGSFQYVHAFVRGQQVTYFALPFNGRQGTSNSLDLLALKPPSAYVFDPKQNDASSDSDRCQRPEDYQYDLERRRLDAVRLDRQGNIFTALPVETDPAGRTSYVPIVQEVKVATSTQMPFPCQDIKSEANLVSRADITVDLAPPPAGVQDGKPSGRPDGKYLAWAIIDPSADVLYPEGTFPPHFSSAGEKDTQHDPMTGLGPQRWGWFQQYLLAYLDGGYIPLETVQPMGKLLAKAQNLYYPEVVFDPNEMMDTDGDIGMGLDIMDFKRGEDGYSPICHVYSFVPKDTKNPEKKVSDIDMTQVTDTKKYVYCLQTP
jgi:hypothetical protein